MTALALLLALILHDGQVNAVAVAPDGKTALSAGRDGIVAAWAMDSGEQAWSIKAHLRGVECLVVSPGGTLLATGGMDGAVKIWEAADGKAGATHSLHNGPVNGLAWDPSGKKLYSAGSDDKICALDVETGKVARSWSAEVEHAFALAVAPDGGRLFAGGFLDGVRGWDPSTGKEAQKFPEHSNVKSIAVSPDGKSLVTVGWGADAKLWDVASGKLVRVVRKRMVFCAAVSPDSRTVALGLGVSAHAPEPEKPPTILIYDLATGSEVRTFAGHASSVMSVAFSPDGKALVAGDAASKVVAWEVATGKPLWPAR